MRYVMAMVAALLFLAVGAAIRADEPQAGQVVSLDVLLADVSGAAVGDGEMTAAKVLDLEKQGKLDAATRIKLAVIENSQGMVNFSEAAPVATARQDFGGGFGGGGGGGGGRGASTAFSLQNYGTMVQVTARVEQDGSIVLNLQVERSRLVANRPAGEEAGAAAIAATKTTQARVHTTARLASNKPTIVGSQQAGVGREAVHTCVVLTASVPEGGKAAAAPDINLKFFPLSNARASDMSKVLREVLTSMPFTIGADERSNSLIVSGSPDVLDIIQNLLARLDEAK